ncbi:dipeptidase [Novosphingobium ovatum]|uniref:dipeptidase n=1 Tax=Novosphingobium ovatum TaxID=1908523 RepID=UPI0029FF0603|nr:dipeptidase [Novosphingobium ovatum]
MRHALFPLLLASAVLAPMPALALTSASPEQIAAAALKAAPVWDGHNDVPEQLRDRRHNVMGAAGQAGAFDFRDTHAEADPDGQSGGAGMQTDIARLRQGRVGAQFWSVYVSAALPEPQAVQATIEQVDVMKRIIARHADTMAYCETAACVETAFKQGRIASLLGAEGGHSIGGSLAVLRQMAGLGVRYMTLTHVRNNAWADSGTDAPAHNGLTPFGKDVVREMQRLGVLVDLSHVSPKTMMDALDVAGAPVIFSHSNAYAVAPHPRNVPDDVLLRLRANGGIIMVNFFPVYINGDLRLWTGRRAGEEARLKALNPDRPQAVKDGMAAWTRDNPKPVATLAQVADHIEHIIRLIGVDHVGLGGDFDGGSVGLQGLPDVSAYPALFVELARRGHSQADLQKLASGNMMRVLKAAETYAATHRADPPIENPTTF